MADHTHSNLTTERMSGTSENEAPGCQGCERLKAHLADAEAQLSEMADRLAGMESLARRSAAGEVALKRKLRENAEADPKSIEVREVLDVWQASHPRAKTPIDGPRAAHVRKALRWGYTIDQLKTALEGLSRFPFAGPAGRQADDSHGARRYDDVEHALGSEKRIEQCIELASIDPTLKPLAPAPGSSTPRSDKPASYDPVRELLDRLEHVKPAGDHQWSARCPAHDDRHASMSVGRGRKGAVVHCHTGCTVAQIAHALRIPVGDLFAPEIDVPAKPKLAVVPDPLPSEDQIIAWANRLVDSPKLQERLKAVKGWDLPTLTSLAVGWDGERVIFPVRDHTGQLVTVARYLPNGRPKMLGLKHRPRGLFPAPESIDGTVWLVEGEPDAVTGHQLGVGAVAVPGANGWRNEWAERLAGRDVVICMDCDREGRQAAERIAATLPAATVIDLDPARDDHYDLSDFARDGGTRDLLNALVVQTQAERQAA